MEGDEGGSDDDGGEWTLVSSAHEILRKMVTSPDVPPPVRFPTPYAGEATILEAGGVHNRLHDGRVVMGSLFVTSYRVVFVEDVEAVVEMPISSLDGVEAIPECRTEPVQGDVLQLLGKDGRVLRFVFPPPLPLGLAHHFRSVALHAASNLQLPRSSFAFTHNSHAALSPPDRSMGWHMFRLADEFDRLFGGLRTCRFRVTTLNHAYSVCDTYPLRVIVPSAASDDVVRASAGFRSRARFPAVVYRYPASGATLSRSAQPKPGITGTRCSADELMIRLIRQASVPPPCTLPERDSRGRMLPLPESLPFPPPPSFLFPENDKAEPPPYTIVDCRPRANTFANTARGGGTEWEEAYGCPVLHLNLANIHSVRTAHRKLRDICVDMLEETYGEAGQSGGWLRLIAALLAGTVQVCDLLVSQRTSVLVHCSDGWDRTTQVVSLVELLLDPFFRTLHGFMVLVEKEWCAYGHKFRDRCAHGRSPSSPCDPDESPQFLMWLDAVHQLLLQFPTSFEFTDSFLRSLALHAYSGRFGTFLANSERERRRDALVEATLPVWSLFRLGGEETENALNPLYVPDPGPLRPRAQERSLELWSAWFLWVPPGPRSVPIGPGGERQLWTQALRHRDEELARLRTQVMRLTRELGQRRHSRLSVNEGWSVVEEVLEDDDDDDDDNGDGGDRIHSRLDPSSGELEGRFRPARSVLMTPMGESCVLIDHK